MNLPGAIFFYLLASLVGLLPFPLLYKLSDFLSFLLRRVLGYRNAVILDNLKNAFPELSENEILEISKKFYLNLSDITLEGIKSFTIKKKQVLERFHLLNPEIVNPYIEAGKSIICVTGHYGNWEWGTLSPSLQLPFKFVGFYKPLKNKRIDKFVRSSRSRFGTILASIRETTRTFEDNRGQAVIYLMAADQSPSNREISHWVNFLGRDTAFLHGPEKHARINNYTVMFIAIRRVKRGYYEVEMSVLAEDPSALADGEITQLYAEKMESLIKEYPANWLWSHKRWKLSR